MNRKKLFVLTVFAVAIAWAVNTFYINYWIPSRELNRIHVNAIRLWSPRAIANFYWFGGSQTEFRFQITPQQELELRQRCLQGQSAGECFISSRQDSHGPHVTAEIQRGTLVLTYTYGD